MKTEIIKIIEGGLVGDKEKISNYAKVLAENFKEQGDEKFYNRIFNVLQAKNIKNVSLDEFATLPVDQESRMNMVDVVYPEQINIDIFLNKLIKTEIENFIAQYKKKDILLSYGMDFSSSILLYGVPGCGKTTLALYIAKQMNLPIVIVRFDSMISSMLGSTAKNIRKIFEYVEKRECILFLDEFDSIAKARNDENELGELKRVVNSLLQNIDIFKKNNIMVAATNHEDILDKAVWRRFDKIIELKVPNSDEIGEYCISLLKEIPKDFEDKGSKMNILQNLLLGCSYSDIKTIISNAVKNMVINDNQNLLFSKIIYEVFLFKYHDLYDVEKLIYFLNSNGISQEEINREFDISLRMIRKLLSKKD